jgi:hypothetical protein
MIRAEVEGVDTSQYIYDTGLTFGSDLGHEVLDLALTQPDIFPQRHNYNRGDNPKELIQLIGAEKARELYRRTAQMKSLCHGNLIQFNQHFFPEKLGNDLVATAPQWLQDLSPGEPSPMLTNIKRRRLSWYTQGAQTTRIPFYAFTGRWSGNPLVPE